MTTSHHIGLYMHCKLHTSSIGTIVQTIVGVGVAQWLSPCLSYGRPGFDPRLLPLRPLSKALTYTCFWGHISMVPQLAKLNLLFCKTWSYVGGSHCVPPFDRFKIKFIIITIYCIYIMPAFFVQNEFKNHITLSGYNQTDRNNFISFH